MSQEGRGCLVADQGGSDKVAQFKIEGRGVRTRSSLIGSAHVKPQSHIHGFGPGRATVHPDLSNRGASA